MHVFLFSPIPYHFIRQRPQQIADRLAARSVHVTYIAPSGWREYFSGERRGLVRAVLISLGCHLRAIGAMVFRPPRRPMREQASGAGPSSPATILSLPLMIPLQKFNSPAIDRLNREVLRRFLETAVLPIAPASSPGVAIVEHPFWGTVLRKGDFSRVYYDCLDDLSLYVGRNSPRRYAEYERDLVRISDGVFVTAGALEDRLRQLYPSAAVCRLPNGVEYDAFQHSAGTANRRAGGRREGGRVAGYVGALSHWFDFELIAETARIFPDVSFELVGPLTDRNAARSLAGVANISLTGRRPYGEIPAIIDGFDVCLIPFRKGEISRSTNPVKLYEYFALGKPVVATAVDELKPFRESELVYWGEDGASFGAALSRALDEHDEKKAEARRVVARANSWDARVDLLMEILGRER